MNGHGKAPAQSGARPQPPAQSGALPQAHIVPCGCDQPIPREPKDDYDKRISPHSTDIFCWQGRWKHHQVQPDRKLPVHLVEVWETGRNGNFEIWAHPSRNQFSLIKPGDEQAWQNWVEHKAADLQKDRKAGRLPPGKPLDVPNWAKGDYLIGYTSKQSFVSFADFVAKQGSLKRPPSVYYFGGHFTADHRDKTNIGWEIGLDKCRFFGNVFNEYIQQPQH